MADGAPVPASAPKPPGPPDQPSVDPSVAAAASAAEGGEGGRGGGAGTAVDAVVAPETETEGAAAAAAAADEPPVVRSTMKEEKLEAAAAAQKEKMAAKIESKRMAKEAAKAAAEGGGQAVEETTARADGAATATVTATATADSATADPAAGKAPEVPAPAAPTTPAVEETKKSESDAAPAPTPTPVDEKKPEKPASAAPAAATPAERATSDVGAASAASTTHAAAASAPKEESAPTNPQQKSNQELKLDGLIVSISSKLLDALSTGKRSLFGRKLKKIRDIFNAMDTDGDHLLSIEQLAAGLQRLGCGLTAEEVIQLFAAFDTDGDGQITLAELEHMLVEAQVAVNTRNKRGSVQISGKPQKKVSELKEAQQLDIANQVLVALLAGKTLFGETLESLEQAFQLMDRNGDMILDRQEFVTGLKRLGVPLGPAQEASVYDYFARDQDGMIDVEDFLAVFSKIYEEGRHLGISAKVRATFFWLCSIVHKYVAHDMVLFCIFF